MYKRNIYFLYFGLSIYPRDLGVMRNETLLDVKIHGRIFDGFGDQDGNGVNKVFSESFISRGRKNVNQFRIIIGGIHNNCSISFIIFEENDVRIIVKVINRMEKFFREVDFMWFDTTKDSSTLLTNLLSLMSRQVVGNAFNVANNFLHRDKPRG